MTALWPLWLGILAGMFLLAGALWLLLIQGARRMEPVCRGRCDGGDPAACTCMGDCGRPGCHGNWNTIQLTALRDDGENHG